MTFGDAEGFDAWFDDSFDVPEAYPVVSRPIPFDAIVHVVSG